MIAKSSTGRDDIGVFLRLSCLTELIDTDSVHVMGLARFAQMASDAFKEAPASQTGISDAPVVN